MTDFFRDKNILVTGGAGFLGSYVVKKLIARGCKNLFVPRSKNYDLTRTADIVQMYRDFRPDIVIHLAAAVGGIGANLQSPGKFFYDNLIMGIQLMEYGRQFNIKKFIAIGTVCSYPKYCQIPFKEEDIWNGYPEETNAPYGLAKKMMLVQSQAYRKQYDFNSIFLIPANLYGPRDNFDPATSHVIPALIKKCLDAVSDGKTEITVWGDGSASREFLYVDDAAEAILLATEHYNDSQPVNIGTGKEITIKQLADIIAQMTDFKGQIVWDKSKPNGQPRRVLDTAKAKNLFNFAAHTSLENGLRQTVDWYKKHYSKKNAH